MRNLVAALLVVAAWCGTAGAKPKVAILGLEVVVTGSKADPKDTKNASTLTEALRQLPRGGEGSLELGPNSNRELIDEKLAGNCDSEAIACMAPIGARLGADFLLYGNIVKTTEKGEYGYKATLKILAVRAAKIEEVSESFVPLSTFAVGPDRPRAWAQRAYATLTGGKPAAAPIGADPGPARLIINANTKRGDVFIDGAAKGRLEDGTLTLTLPEGSYDLEIEAPGYKRYEATVIATGGLTRT